MRKKWYCFIIFLFLISAQACQSTKTTERLSQLQEEQVGEDQRIENDQLSRNLVSKDQVSEKSVSVDQIKVDDIKDERYHKDGIEGTYPSIISGGTEEERNLWNEIITTDFNKILQIYSFNPFPELTPSPTTVEPTILTITNSIKTNNQHFLSIFYRAAYFSRFSAYPTDLVYTTNIDKETSQRIKLSDIVTLDMDFVKNFREWKFESVEEGNDELNQAIRDYVNDMSDEDLLMGFQAADQIGSGNVWGIYSYLTPERLGISLSVPNYIGDHVEFERDYSELGDFLTKDFKLK
jgi:hypothetical protein